MALKDLVRVEPISKGEACEVIKALHYSGTVAWASNEHFGVFYRGVLAGAVQFGPAMNPASGDKVVAGSGRGTWLELNRMAFDVPEENVGSFVIARSLRLLQARRPSVEWVQSFADERCEKLGAVYQAANFLYVGRHRTHFYELDGAWYHRSCYGRKPTDKRGWGCGPRIAYFVANQHRATKHTFWQFRYVKPLRKGVARRLRLPPQPYPKPAAFYS